MVTQHPTKDWAPIPKMKSVILILAAWAIAALVLTGCSGPLSTQSMSNTQDVQAAIATGIVLTLEAEEASAAAHESQTQVLQSLIGTAVAQTEIARNAMATSVSGTETANAPTATPSLMPSATASATATAMPTETSTVTATIAPRVVSATPSPTSAPQGVIVYDAYRAIQTLASLNDSQTVSCQSFVDTYNFLGSLPSEYAGVPEYAWARAHVLSTSRDEMLNCEAYLAGANTDEFILFIQWGMSRQGTEEALKVLRPIIVALGFTP